MTSPGWPDIVVRLHDTLAGCDRDTDLELAAGPRRLHLLVRRETVRGVCPPYDERRLAALGWRAPGGGSGWWYETPRTAEGLRWWSGFVARTAAEVLTDEPGALSCQILPPTGPRVRPGPTVPAPRIVPAPDRTAPDRPAPDRPAPDRPEPSGTAPGGTGPGGTAATGRSVEERLGDAVARRDLAGYLGVLATATVCVPLAAEPAPGRDFPWTLVKDGAGAPLLPVFTSTDALTAFAGDGVPFVAVPCAELLTDWPDRAWGLAVDAGSRRTLALAAPALTALLAANVPTD